VIGETFWNRRLNADPGVLGRTLDIEREPYTIIGVLPAGFHGLTGHADLWMTVGARREYRFDPQEAWDHEFTMVARLATGITPERAKNDVAVLGVRANAAFPAIASGAGWGATARLLDRTRVDPVVRRSLLVSLGAVLFVLLIACANLANLFLVRASTRQREIAVRLPLAPRGLSGLVPAANATRPSLTAALKDGTGEQAPRTRILRRLTSRNALVVIELALALVLFAGSGVMARSLANLVAVRPGFDADRVLTLRLNSAQGARARASLPAFYQALLGRLRALPGVESVALGDCPPLAGGCNGTVLWMHGRSTIAATEPAVGIHWVTPGWFATLLVPLLAGRFFTDA